MTAQDVAFRNGLRAAFEEILLIIELQSVHVEVLVEERDQALLEVERMREAVMFLNGDDDES